SPAPVEVDELAPPGVLAAVGLEAVDAELLDEVAALLGPPVRGSLIGQIGHEPEREPPAAVAVRAQRAVGGLLADEHVVADGRLGIRLHLAERMRAHLDERN